MPIYLDHAATTPCEEQVVETMTPYYSQNFGNPSSPYTLGGESQQAIETARNQVARLINAKTDEIYFTSGGTESDNTALKGMAYARRRYGNHLITTKIEHPAVIETCRYLEKQGFKITYLPVDEYGRVNPDDVSKTITDKTVLVSVMHANNEVGTIQPLKEIAAITKKRNIVFHTDAVQTAGSVPVDVNNLGIDLLSLSAHKMYGPKGVGALYVRKGMLIDPLFHGGHQERGVRASTENVPGIVGLGRAAELAAQKMSSEEKRITKLRRKLIKGLQASTKDVKLNGHPEQRLPGHVNVSFAHIEGEGIIMHLDAAGIYCSTGSACSSHNLQASPVLLAMGLSHELAHGSIRFSLGRSTGEADIDRVLETLPGIVTKLRSMSPLTKATT